MIDAIRLRRAVRDYIEQPIPEQLMQEIMTAAMYAPSANGVYPWEFVIVENAETRDWLSKLTPWSAPAKTAAAAVVIIGHETDSPQWVEDCAVAAEHLWLAAVDRGLGGCWIQIRGNANAEKELKERLHIPDEHRVLCLLTLGTPVKDETPHDDTAYDKSKVKYEKY